MNGLKQQAVSESVAADDRNVMFENMADKELNEGFPNKKIVCEVNTCIKFHYRRRRRAFERASH